MRVKVQQLPKDTLMLKMNVFLLFICLPFVVSVFLCCCVMFILFKAKGAKGQAATGAEKFGGILAIIIRPPLLGTKIY